MAQKVNPIANRLQLNQQFKSCWFSHYYYSNLLSRDVVLQQYFTRLKNHLDVHRTEPKHPFRVSLYVIGADRQTFIKSAYSKSGKRRMQSPKGGKHRTQFKQRGWNRSIKLRFQKPLDKKLLKKRNKEFRQLLFRLPRQMKELIRYKFRRHIIKRGCLFQNKPKKRQKKPNRFMNKPSAIFYSRYLLKKTIIDVITATPVLSESTKRQSTPKGFWTSTKPTQAPPIHYNLPTQFYHKNVNLAMSSKRLLDFNERKRLKGFSMVKPMI